MSGACILAGLCAFALFVIYDVNSVRFHFGFLKPTFFLGLVLLVGATVMMFAAGWDGDLTGRARQVVLLALAAVFFVLLVYTLFFALPFENTYLREDGRPRVCSHGMYALCRHPGVIWFIGLYGCFALAMPSGLMILGGMIFCVCNVLYVVIQDVWTFPNYFSDYGRYKEEVPFLIPTIRSVKKCIETIKTER